MRLAEALKLRADLNTRILELGGRLNSNAKVQEGESPAEDPGDLLAELDAVSDQMQDLITRINLTNSVTRADDGRTLTELIARRDILIRKSEILRAFPSTSTLDSPAFPTVSTYPFRPSCPMVARYMPFAFSKSSSAASMISIEFSADVL